MPVLVKKFLVFATVDALFLQPHAHRSQKPSPGLEISYGNPVIRTAGAHPKNLNALPSLEAHGVVGKLIQEETLAS